MLLPLLKNVGFFYTAYFENSVCHEYLLLHSHSTKLLWLFFWKTSTTKAQHLSVT